MNSNLLYPQIGKVIASTGSRQFPRMLHDLIQAHLSIDATQIRQLPLLPCDSTLIDETVFSSDEQPDGDFNDPSRLHRISRKGNARLEIQVIRADSTYGFSAFERSRLDAISPLLLPMLEKHVDALQPTPERHTKESLEQRFVDRLAQSGLTLSERERQVCLGLLAGHTAPEQGDRLGLKVNTVESYLRRAAIKLGISGRHSLMRWMYAEA
ncbi:LuxR family transcriptional regulator [Pseudomonas sp. LB-090624]|uniref:helix-turn-helix transcriptional regulator n=1 Tax=Pseudomonas TaxID=286 RepID=UPI000D9365B8|nr:MULTISPECIES: helix-turn-helix transcriptional regulator [unclassified Pseudomonas]MCX2891564.1 helix-turn-helix transcriptional regulator [Pseudomonas sp. DCB_BI]MDH4550699.1 helix-turn-helix transcriptional regulator [Pseudomonas sp. BN607]PYB73713.1 LuxR family transcriptional regulator [Pseudomonas sp. LB-090624]